MNTTAALAALIAGNRAGRGGGVASWCTAHPETLRAILNARREDQGVILIEATCNQVNQHGGYTGLTPATFRDMVARLARDAGVAAQRIMLGGDHLGPNPWKHLPARAAMAEADEMVRAYVEAGFTKLHLDASMACADDHALDEATMAARAAELCAAAESARGAARLCYVIGTEVPIPGGETAALDSLAVTRADAVANTYGLHRRAFEARGLAEAFERVVGIVVQPGVDYGNAQVFAFDAGKAAALSGAVANMPGFVYEAHSTDYQSEAALRELVAGHFAILKVGPELTFAYREAVLAMAAIARELGIAPEPSVADALNAAMDADPRHWRPYIADGRNMGVERFYGLSDRVRYYWPAAGVRAAVAALTASIDGATIPPGLLWQYAGRVGAGAAPLSRRIVEAKVGAVAAKYQAACALRA